MVTKNLSRKIISALAILLAILLIWYLRTLFHGLVMLFYTMPVIFEAIIVAWLIGKFLIYRSKRLTEIRTSRGKDAQGREYSFNYRWAPWIADLLLIVLILVSIPLANWCRMIDLAGSLEYKSIDTLPDSTVDTNIRLMPMEVAARYAKDSLQLSQYKLGRESITIQNGHLSWTFPLTPDGLILSFTKKNRGVMIVDATTHDKNSRLVWKDMAIGQGMLLTDNLWWNVYRQRYFVRTEKPYYIVKDDEIYTVIPAISYSWRFKWGILYTVPEFAGLFIVNTAGNIDFVTPEEALELDILEGNRIFPEKLARLYVSSYQYRKGILNKLFIHEDQIQIQDVEVEEGPNNPQPFLMITEKGPVWFVSTEPYGRSRGIFKIFIVDARTGELSLLALPEDQALTGPIMALDYIRKSNPLVDWGQFKIVEPLPFIRDGVLYWKAAVIPVNGAGIAYQAFIDSRTNHVVEIEDARDIAAFVEGIGLYDKAGAESDGSDLAIVDRIERKVEELKLLIEELRRQIDN